MLNEIAETARVGDLTVQFQRRGHGPDMVLVHGLLGYSFSWRRVMETFSREREVFALDMPGSGFSDCSPSVHASLFSAADRLLTFLDSQAIRSCDLVGSSYGGSTVLRLATMRPERVRTLTLVSPANPWSRIGRKRLGLLGIPLFAQAFPPLARVFRPIHRLSIRRMYGDPGLVTAETLKGYSLPLMRKGVLEHAVRIARNWDADMAELKACLPSAADIPALLIWGSKDRLVERSSADIMARYFKHCSVRIMEGAGHLPYEEFPDEFASLVSGFLAQHPPPVLDGK
jgi:pimeloyl-ACP methyl ester carboxylesterase